MFAEHYLFQFLLAFLPALIYSTIIYFNDRNNIRLRTTVSYLIGGYISISLLFIVQRIFPHLHDPFFTNDIVDDWGDTIREPTLISLLTYCLFQVAMIEEMVKGMAWHAIGFIRNSAYTRDDSLFSTMFYTCMVSVGFAGIENLSYFIEFQEHNVILTRSFSAVILHMLCGLIMGYFFALSRLKKDVMSGIGQKCLGLLSAIALHGAYNFSIYAEMNGIVGPLFGTIQIMYVVLLVGLIAATMCGRSLLSHSLRYAKVQERHIP